MILKYCDIDVNLRDNWGRSVIELASSTNKQLLLKHGNCFVIFLHIWTAEKLLMLILFLHLLTFLCQV